MTVIVQKTWRIMRAVSVNDFAGRGQLLRRHALLGLIVTAYAAVAFWLTTIYQVNVSDDKAGVLIWSFATNIPQMIFVVVFGRLLYLSYVLKVDDRIGRLKRDVMEFLTDRDRIVGGLIAVLIMSGTLVAFAQLKNLIPEINPYSWDVAFMNLDRLLHFGVLPHEYLHAVFGGYYGISLFTGLYNVWLFMMYFVLVIACFMRSDSRIRMQYLLAFVFTWAIGGNLLATVFSSAGPVYYGLLGFGDAYADLLERLARHAATGALSVVDTQALLWYIHMHPKGMNAISAFPSMHVASSVLMAIFAFRLSRWAGWAAVWFTTMIMIGSVLLAWHYAVDGYVGGLIAVASWYLAGQLVQSRFGGFSNERG